MIDIEFIKIFPNNYDVLTSFSILIFGYFVTSILSKSLKLNDTIAHIIYFWHMLFSFIYVYFSIHFVSDSTSYFIASLSLMDYDFEVGTNFIYILTDFFTKTFALSYLSISLLFGVLAAFGLVLLYSSLRENSNFDNKYKWLILILILTPSLSFWSGGIGKDSLSFFLISLYCWGCTNFESRQKFVFISLVLLYFIRPHVSILLSPILGFSINYYFQNSKFRFKSIILILSLIAFITFVFFAFEYVGLGNFDIKGYLDTRFYYSALGANSAISNEGISQLSLLFNFLYFPILVDSFELKYLPFAFEGIYIFIITIVSIYFGSFKNIDNFKVFLAILVSFMLMLLLFSNSLGNYGLIVRQKIMLLPLLFFLISCFIGSRKSII
jgi:hypothetical protein